jgi:nucleoside-diphosphate-sugar epimerase
MSGLIGQSIPSGRSRIPKEGRDPMARVLIAGCGYVGVVLGRVLADESHGVWGLRRRPLSLPEGIVPIVADLGLGASLAALPPDLDYVFYMASPGGSDEAFYRTAYVEGLSNLLHALDRQGQRPVRIFFVSSTAVYAQRRAEWVDEESPTEPVHFSGRRLLEAERILFEGPFAGTAVRFAGIYGPRRTRLIEDVRAGRAVWRKSPPQWTNRIHRDDCAGVLAHLMQLERPEKIYLGVDCEPAEQGAVLRWLAGALGAPAPRAVRAKDPALRARRDNKRCRNDRLLATGYTFLYPTYREGYSAVLEGMT